MRNRTANAVNTSERGADFRVRRSQGPKRVIHRDFPLLERPLGDIVAQVWEWIKADNPIKPKKPKRPKRVIHRELPLRDRSAADVSAQAWEWIKGDNPIKPRKPKTLKAPPPQAPNPQSTPTPPPASATPQTPAQAHSNNPPRKSAKDRARTAWIWIKGDNPVKPPKPKKQHKMKSKTSNARMAPIPNGEPKRTAKPQRQLPHHPILPQIPEQEESGPSIPSQIPTLNPAASDAGLGDEVHNSIRDDQNDAISETSSFDDSDPPEYHHHHSRPPSYMTVDHLGEAGVHLPGAY